MRRTALGLAAMAGMTAWVQAPSPPASASDVAYFDPLERDGFRSLRKSFAAYADHHGASGTQHVCALGLDVGSDTVVWVRWEEGRRLILLEPTTDDGSGDALLRSRRDISLDDDVVPTSAGVGSSTYLVAADWVDSLRSRCAKHGAVLAVRSDHAASD